MIKGGVPTGMMQKPHGVNVSTSVYGQTVALIYGLTQTQGSLIWYNDWKSHDNPVNFLLAKILGNTGGKGKKSKKSGIKYYSAAIDLLLGHAPLRNIFTIWYNNNKFAAIQCSASGTISGGAFTFTPKAGNSKTTFTGYVPGTPSYIVTVPNFVSDMNSVKANGVYLQPAISPPGVGQYSVDSSGNYQFNAAQAGAAVSITYRTNTITGGDATLCGIYACTIAESYSTTFNDYGGPGSIAVAGVWDRPLWNKTFPVPGRVDAGAYSARDPYSFSWNGTSTFGSPVTVNFPSALNGKQVTVYYTVPAVYKSDGSFFSSKYTPMAILNLEFEQVMSSGAEYTRHEDQQVVQSWAAGVGSVEFDLGAVNAMANMNFEVHGSFAQWPNGDCDVADVITDIFFSGPVLV